MRRARARVKHSTAHSRSVARSTATPKHSDTDRCPDCSPAPAAAVYLSLALPEHVHVHAPHDLVAEIHSGCRQERNLESVSGLLLSISSLAIAWSGYQAARWSGHQS